jgi:acetyl-CoA carboxylase beta subunit
MPSTKADLKKIEKPKHAELLIIPKKNFMNWYKFTRDQVQEIELKRKESGSNFMECPNCRSIMEDYYLKDSPKREIWHLCPHCELTFSHKQYNRFTEIIMRAGKTSKIKKYKIEVNKDV